MPCCAVISCRVRSQDLKETPGKVSFHRFPPEPHLKEKWADVTGRRDWIPTKTSTICSRHFLASDYISMTCRRHLKPEAIPTQEINRLICTSKSIENMSESRSRHVAPLKRPSTKTAIETVKRQKLCNEVENRQSPEESRITVPSPAASLKRLSTEIYVEDIKREKNYNVVAQQHQQTASEDSSKVVTKRETTNELQPSSNSEDELEDGNSLVVARKQRLRDIIRIKDYVIKKQRRQIRALQARNRRLKTKVLRLEDILKELEQNFNFRNEEVAFLEATNVTVQELVARCSAKGPEDFSKGQYPPALKTFALTLHDYSPKAYEYVRSTFNTCLPHPRTIQKWYENIEDEPGFTKEAIIT